MAASSEQLARAFDAGGKPIDFLEGVVEGDRGSGGRRPVEEIPDRHGAVMPGPNGNAVLVENGPEVVRMHARDGEGNQACLVAGRAHDAQIRNLGQYRRRMIEQGVLVALRGVAIQVEQKIHRRAQSDASRDIGRARLELVGQGVVRGLGEGHGEDHLPAALPRRHALDQLFAAVQDAYSGVADVPLSWNRLYIAAQLQLVTMYAR